jgi:hypothetical protein
LSVGWLLVIVGLTPILRVLLVVTNVDLPELSPVIGRNWHGPLIAPGLACMLLAVFPTDAFAIRVVSAIFFAYFTIFCLLMLFGFSLATVDGQPLATLLLLASLALGCAICASALVSTLCCDCCRTGYSMAPRAALRRVWLFFRISCAMFAFMLIIFAWNGNERLVAYQIPDYTAGQLSMGFSFLLTLILTDPRLRGRTHRLLGNLGQRAESKEAEAATIAALIGGGDTDSALAQGARRFRALPLSALAESHMCGQAGRVRRVRVP